MTGIFDEIYAQRTWGDGVAIPLSGVGSDPDNALTYVCFVRDAINQMAVSTVVDFGHGDWNMWRDYGFEGVSYLGIEVAELPHKIASTQYTNDHRKFVLTDCLKNRQMPIGDMLISKDVLQHLSNSEIVSLLKLFSNYRLLLLCNDVFVPWRNPIALLKYYLQVRRRLRALVAFRNPFFVQSRKNNHDIKSGDGRGIDLLEPPFAEELRGHKLKCQLDFKGSGSRNNGTVKRLYFFERQEINA